MTTISGKIVLLTGASGGIGTRIARLLADRGATVIAVARSSEKLEQLSAEIEAMGGKVIAIPQDLTRVEELPNLLDKCDRVGGVDILINNAGIEIYRAFPDYSLAELQAVMSINLLAAMELTRLLLPAMLSCQQGHIVNIASLAGKTGHPYDSVYSASKAGLLMWSDALRQELVATGVKMTTVCPGYVASAGLLADTGIGAPRWAGVSQPEAIAKAVIRAIAYNQGEIAINGNRLMTGMTKLLLTNGQLFPTLKDAVNRWIGVTKLNRLRIKSSTKNNKNLTISSSVR